MTPGPADEWTDEAVAAFWGVQHSARGAALGVRIAVIVAAVVTVGLVVVMGDLAFAQVGRMAALEQDVHGLNTRIGMALGGVAAAGLLAVVWGARHRDVAMEARIAVALVAVFAAIVPAAGYLSRYLEPSDRRIPLMSVQPATTVTLIACALVIAGAILDGALRRRRLAGAPRWLHGTVVFALAFLALLGIWLPVVVPDQAPLFWDEPRAYAVAMVPQVLVPPGALALATAVIAIARPSWMRAIVRHAAIPLALGVAVAVFRRLDASPTELALYGTFAHLLIAAAAFALCAIAALAWSHGRALRAHRLELTRAAPWVQRGTVDTAADAPEAGAWNVDGWLGGVRTTVQGFILRTSRGDLLRVPDGTPLLAPMPAATATAATGAHLTALQRGDQVTVTGFVSAGGDGPYREGSGVLPGDRGLVIAVRRRPHETLDRDVLLVLFRPCLVFLIVAALAALPGVMRDPGATIDPTTGMYDPP